jgi:hypothetical protein
VSSYPQVFRPSLCVHYLVPFSRFLHPFSLL